MANPNIVNVSTINGETATATLTTSAASIVSNAASSGKIFKINTVLCSNIDGVNAVDVSIAINSAAAGAGTDKFFARTVVVPADSSLVIIDKNSSLYLLEDKSITALASADSDCDIVISYEEIS